MTLSDRSSPISVLAKEPASLSAEDALTAGWGYAAFAMQVSTSTGWGAVIEAAGIGSMEFLGMLMPAAYVVNVAASSDDRNLVLCPLLMDLLRPPEKLPDFALGGVLNALHCGVIGRPAVAAKLLDHGGIAVLMGILRQASPTEWIATAGFSRRPHGFALTVVRELVDSAQAGGADLTAELLSCGYIDTLLSALSAAEKVGAENVNAYVICWGSLTVPTLLIGEALPQIEDKLRAIPSVLRYLKDSEIFWVSAFRSTSGTLATIVAGEHSFILPRFGSLI